MKSELVVEGTILKNNKRFYTTSLILFATLKSYQPSLVDRGIPSIGIFLDLTRAFECVNHDLLLDKLSEYGVRDVPLKWVESFLIDRQQYVQVDGLRSLSKQRYEWQQENSSLRAVQYGVPTGSVLGPYLYLLYVNTVLENNGDGNIIMYCDDTTILSSELELANSVLNSINYQFLTHNLLVNSSKTNCLLLRPRQCGSHIDPPKLGDVALEWSCSSKFLGVTVDSALSWKDEVSTLQKKLYSAIYVIWNVTRTSGNEAALVAYHSLFMSKISYSIILWGGSSASNLLSIFRLQKRAVRTMLSMPRTESCRGRFRALNLLTVPALYALKVVRQMERSDLTLTGDVHGHNTRKRKGPFYVGHHRTRVFEQSLQFIGRKLLNDLPTAVLAIEDDADFLGAVRRLLLEREPYSLEELSF